MTKVKGHVLFATYEKNDVFNWQDPTTGQMKPIRSIKVLLDQGDGTVTRESIALPPDMSFPALNIGEVYGFRIMTSVNKKRLQVSYTLVPGREPLPPLEIE